MSQEIVRRWIIGRRECHRCRENNVRAKVVDAVKGIIQVTCRREKCGYVELEQADSFKDKKPCARCGYTRDITVFYRSFTEQQPVERFEKHCPACKLELSAKRHRDTAHALSAQAAAIRAERAKRLVAG